MLQPRPFLEVVPDQPGLQSVQSLLWLCRDLLAILGVVVCLPSYQGIKATPPDPFLFR